MAILHRGLRTQEFKMNDICDMLEFCQIFIFPYILSRSSSIRGFLTCLVLMYIICVYMVHRIMAMVLVLGLVLFEVCLLSLGHLLQK